MGNARVFHVRFKQLSYISLYACTFMCICTLYRYTISTYEYKHFWLAGKYGCRGRDKANAAQLLPSLKNREGDQRREYVNAVHVRLCVCVRVCNNSYAFDIFAKDMQTSSAHKQNPMQILLKTENFKVNTAATRYGDGAEAGTSTGVTFVCLHCQAKRFSLQMTNFQLALTRCRLHGNFSSRHYHDSGIASSAIKLAPLYAPRAVRTLVIYRVSQQTPIISDCKQQFALTRVGISQILMGWHLRTCNDSGNQNDPKKNWVI